MNPYLRVLDRGGAAVEHIFKSCHLPTEAIEDPAVWIPKAQVYSLPSKAAKQTGENPGGLLSRRDT